MNSAAPSGLRDRNTQIVLLLIALFVISLTLHGMFSRTNLDRFGDLTENYAWGALWQWGYFKHPPLFGWITAAWFLVFPHKDWAYYFLSSVNAAVALLALWRISLRYGDSGLAILAISLAIVMPPISFLGLNYNANSAMTSLWALSFLFYLRGLESRRWYDAVILGVLAAFAMLAKYHSAVLLGGLLIHALIEKEGRAVLFSAFGAIVLAVFLVLIAPHIWWLIDNEFLPITYAEEQGDGHVASMLYEGLVFFVTPVAYCGLSFLLLISMRRFGDGVTFLPTGNIRALFATLEGRALLAFAIMPTVLTYVLGFAAGAELSGVWGIPFYTAFALILALILPPDLRTARLNSVLTFILIFMVVIVVVAPFWRRVEEQATTARYQIRHEELAHEFDRIWEKDANGQGRPFIMGDQVMNNSIAFYSKFNPRIIQSNSLLFSKNYASPEKIAKDGLVVVCIDGDADCKQPTDGLLAPDAIKETVDLLGFDGKTPFKIAIWIQKPKT